MDDNFNTNNVFGNTNPENAPQPPSQMGTAPGANNYNTPYSAPYNTPYNAQQNQTPYTQMPYNTGNNQYSNVPPVYPQTPYTTPSFSPKKKKNTGRNIREIRNCLLKIHNYCKRNGNTQKVKHREKMSVIIELSLSEYLRRINPLPALAGGHFPSENKED